MIADEPTTALDVTVQAQILELIDALREENNSAVMLITHDLGVVAETIQQVMVMYAGRTAEYATVQDLLTHPHIHIHRGSCVRFAVLTKAREDRWSQSLEHLLL